MIRVLHIIKSLGRGGAEMLLPETIALHNQLEFEMHCIYFLPWKNQMVQAIKDNGGKVTCIPAQNNFKIILTVNKIATYIKQHNIDIVHCHLPWAGIVGRLAGKLSNVPVIYTEHNKWERYHVLTFALNKLTFGLQQLAVPVSADVEQSIRHYYKKSSLKIQTILNGVNTDKFSRALPVEKNIRSELSIPESSFVIGTVSVFRTQKRLPLWLDIAYKVHQKYPNTYFLVVGDGPLREEVHRKAKELNMASYLHFAGLQEEVRPYFKAMDVFMMASEFEGLPIALLESMSMECIPCCTKAGGITEVIDNGVNGLCVDVNEPLGLADKISYLLENRPQVEDKLKRAAREKVIKFFSIQRMVSELEQVYRKAKNNEL